MIAPFSVNIKSVSSPPSAIMVSPSAIISPLEIAFRCPLKTSTPQLSRPVAQNLLK